MVNDGGLEFNSHLPWRDLDDTIGGPKQIIDRDYKTRISVS